MELVVPPSSFKASLKKYNRVVAKVKAVLDGYKGNTHIVRAFKNYYTKYAEARYLYFELQETWNMREEMQNIKNSFQEPEDQEHIKTLESILHFELRDQVDFAVRFPIYYMDVHPEAEEDMSSLYDMMCGRDKYADTLDRAGFKVPRIPGNASKFGVKCNGDAINKRINDSLVKYEKDQAGFIFRSLGSLPRGISSFRFIFDGRRKPEKLRFPDNTHLHLFKFLYLLDWKDVNVPDEFAAEYSQVSYINRKIGKWLFDDVIYYLIEHIVQKGLKTDLKIFISHDGLGESSYFFTRLGKMLCKSNVTFEFNDVPLELQGIQTVGNILEGKVIQYDMGDIQSVLAAYYETSHEIWRANVSDTKRVPTLLSKEDKPPSIVNNMTPTGSPLYFKIMECFSECLNLAEAISNEQLNTDLTSTFIEEFMKSIKVEKTNTPELKILVAGPGTGKSTYSNKYNIGYVILDLDYIQRNLGTYEKDINERYMNAITKIIKSNISDDYPILQKVLIRTIFVNNKTKRFSKLEEMAIYCHSKLLDKCLEAGYNVCLETSGIQVNKKNVYDSCGNVSSPESKEVTEFYKKRCTGKTIKCKLVILYLPFINQYNQQLFRYLDEQRLIRYYSLYFKTLNIWQGPQNFERWDIDVFMYDKVNLVKIVDKGIIDFKKNKDFIANIKDSVFKEFLRNNFN